MKELSNNDCRLAIAETRLSTLEAELICIEVETEILLREILAAAKGTSTNRKSKIANRK